MTSWVEYGQQTRYDVVRGLAKDLAGDIVELGASRRYHILGDSITVDIADADIQWNLNDGLPFPDDSIDHIVACEIIEHMRSPHSFLREIRRVLKPGGILIVTTPNICCLKNRIKLLCGKFPVNVAMADFYRYWTDVDNAPLLAHYSDYSIPVITDALRKEGFTILKTASNGIYFRGKRVLPLALTPPALGENMIIKARLVK